MNTYYTSERNAQIIIAVLKANNINKVIASPGTTNICFTASIQQDPFFHIYSAPDERSAAYMACGLAAETGEPVVISCTGATASRNYMPGLTEAYYRKLPVLAITSSRRSYRIGHNFDQVTDRTLLPRDVAKMSVQLPLVYDLESEWNDVIMANKAVLELNHHGKGPVHINLETNYSRDYSVKKLPDIRIIRRITINDKFPELKSNQKIGILIGAHLPFEMNLQNDIESFCEKHNAVVLCDHICNYKGKYSVLRNAIGAQELADSEVRHFDLLIHIGDVLSPEYQITADEVWRINPDGELRDPYHKLKFVFEMEEDQFFKYYSNHGATTENTLTLKCNQEEEAFQTALKNKISEFPFSNCWIAYNTSSKLPENSEIHFGIQDSLRFWSYFNIPNTVTGFCNTGGFGIDGSMSSTIGASLAHSDKLYYCVLGDLAFFYDLNSLGNRHVGNNIRILLINNGLGNEFKLKGNPGYMFGEETDKYIAAAGHYGNKSPELVKHYAQDLGFKYLSASNKEDYLKVLPEFVSPDIGPQSIILEAFTTSEDDVEALDLLRRLVVNEKILTERKAKDAVKSVIGQKGVDKIKKIIKR